ncbi:MAG TPA: NADH-ubiquinone oxidoreductase-F iron-sulfur binding region domain-containing protein [Planctomycetota bacterium]|nr:NADH-ubiquinone oxidoreductase-F iron-sulfur binding region domain-containing protein [Planctomycetota bacterium]
MIDQGGLVVFDDTVDMAKQARFSMESCAIESCGRCTTCRIGGTCSAEIIDRIVAGQLCEQNVGCSRTSAARWGTRRRARWAA